MMWFLINNKDINILIIIISFFDIINKWKAQQQGSIIKETIQNGLINFNNKFNFYG